MKKLRTYGLILFLLIVFSSKAQQLAHYNHYFTEPILYNPSYAGYRLAPNIIAIYNKRWAQIPGSPQNNLISFDAAIPKTSLGGSLRVIQEKRGLLSTTQVQIGSSYILKMGEETFLRAGIAVGINNFGLNLNRAEVKTPEDPLLLNYSQNGNFFITNSAGLSFSHKGFNSGFAVNQVLDAPLTETAYKTVQHYNFSLSQKIRLKKESEIFLVPLSLITISQNNPAYIDANLMFDYKNKFYTALSYKHNHAFGIAVGARFFESLSLGYSYDIVSNNLSSHAGLTHEIMLGYRFVTKEYKPKGVSDKEKLRRLYEALETIDTHMAKQEAYVYDLIDKFFEMKNNHNKEEIEEDIEDIKHELELFKESMQKQKTNILEDIKQIEEQMKTRKKQRSTT
jgi:type IX secretion system PorP/SprF family membrane protein